MRSVLIVDDDATVRHGLSKVVQWHAVSVDRVLTARNGREALELIENDQIDIVFSDIKMPDIDGLELARRIHEKGLSIPLILFSAYDDFSYAQSACRYGVKEYILKPINSEKIRRIEMLASDLLGRRDSRDRLVRFVTSTDFKEGLRKALRSGDWDYITSFLASPSVRSETDFSTIIQMAVRIIEMVYGESGEALASTPAEIPSLNQAIGDLMSKKDRNSVLEYLSCILERIFEFRISRQGSHQQTIISMTDQIIANEYSDPNFNVNALADSLALSANYLSTIYKKNTGENLSSRILRERVDRAKQMIGNPKVNIGIVARSVGFSDSHYFARVFKRTVGCTPSEFRNLQFSYRENRLQ